jgi:tetratricopeptide (TPR) repeat protein
MLQAISKRSRFVGQGQSLRLRIGTKVYNIAQENALALAHALLKAKRYDLASRICEVGLRWEAHASEAAVLLACCKAGQQKYGECNRLLQVAISDGESQSSDRIHASLVYQSRSMMSNAIAELTAAADELPDMPILWLLLGDQFAEMGNHRKAALCWRLAIDRDNRRGPAALAARRQLTQIRSPVIRAGECTTH